MDYKSVFDVPLKGKTIILRTDLNSNVVEGRVVVSSRLREHAKTIYSLCEEGAKVVVLSHQGRKGDPDFISLKRHFDFIKKFVDKKASFVSWEQDFVLQIKKMQESEIIVLENTRFLDIETDEKKTPQEFSELYPIKQLSQIADYFVQNALSVCHRNHATVVGFAKIPCLVGPILERELLALEKLNLVKDSKLLILGGAKPQDSLDVLESMLKQGFCDQACLGGLFGEMFLRAKGKSLGKKDLFLDEKGYKKFEAQIKKILSLYANKLILPVDLACQSDNSRKEISIENLPTGLDIMDIGRETTELFKKKIRESKVVVFNGPLGVYEKQSFSIGTKKILETIAFGRTFSILGGGDTERAIFSLGLLPQDFSHLSLAGKALLEFLAGEKLPGLEILNKKNK